MATQTLNVRIAQKWDTRENWAKSTLVLLKGELALDEKGTYKVGDGVNTWSGLSFAGGATIVTSSVAPAKTDKDYDLGQLWLNTTNGTYSILVSVAGDEATWQELSYAGEVALKANAADVYDKTAADALFDEKANAADVYDKTAADALFDEKANAADVYNKTEANGLLDAKANAADVFNKTEITDKLALKADAADTYTKSDVDDLLDDKANAADVYDKTAADALFDEKANAADVYDKTAADALFDAKANAADVFNKTEISDKLALKADLVDGLVPSSQLPSYVDDVVEVATKDALPEEGEGGKIYVITGGDYVNYQYRWSGTQYVQITSGNLVLGETAGTAYEGNKGLALDKAINGDTSAAEGSDARLGLTGRLANAEAAIEALEGATEDLAALAYKDTVATADIDDAAVTADKLATDSVTTDKIEDGAVTDDKIDSVDVAKLFVAEGDTFVLQCGTSVVA